MARKIDVLFEEFNPDILSEIFDDFAAGVIEIQYQITIVDISGALRNKGIMTKKRKKQEDDNKAAIEEFYAFQKHSFDHNSKKQ